MALPDTRTPTTRIAAAAVIDRELRLVQLDDAFAALLGATPADLVGRSLAELLPALGALARQLLAADAGGGDIVAPWPDPLRPADYTILIRPVRSHAGALLGADLCVEPNGAAASPHGCGGTRRGEIVAAASDNPHAAAERAARQAAEQQAARLYASAQEARDAAEQARTMLDTLIACAPIGVAFFDHELRWQHINEQLAVINGFPPAAHLGRRMPEVLPDLAPTVEPMLRAVVATGVPILDVEISGETPARPGETRIWRTSYFPVRSAAGQVLGVGVICAEITEHRHTAAALRASQEREQARVAELATVLEAVPAAVWIAHDRESRVITGNRAAQELLRVPTGKNHSVSAPTPERPTHFRILKDGVELAPEELPVQQAAALGIEVRDFEEELVFDDGTTCTLLGNATPLLDADGQPRGAVAAFLDITQRKAAERERDRLHAAEQQARERAEAAVRMREVSFSVAAHELRTPLTALLGQAQLLARRAERSDQYSERDRRTIAVIAGQADRLNRMIAALLDVARLERGQIALDLATLDLAALITRVVEETQPTLDRHSLIWEAPDEPLLLRGDALRLEQVLQNLIGNAVKYSPAGGVVTVHATREGRQARVAVSDQGLGIPASALPHLFQRFYRAPNVDERQISGMGIGLYVVREIAQLHGGSVAAASVEGEGSTFTVLLPLAG